MATEFAICDQWHSSIPGPTWPNRFFVHGASSSGLDASPSTAQIGGWELPDEGFQYPNGSIYQALAKAGIPYRFYNDTTGLPQELSLYSDDPRNGSLAGAVPQVSALSGVTLLDINSLGQFASDLQGPYPYPYTFIEPHYGDIVSGNLRGRLVPASDGRRLRRRESSGQRVRGDPQFALLEHEPPDHHL